MLASFFCGEFLLHIRCLLYFSVGSFSYTFHAGFKKIIWAVSVTHPVLALSLSGEFLLHIHACFVFCGEFFLHIPYWLFCDFFLMWNPRLALFLSGKFLLHIPCWLHFIWGVYLTRPMLVSFLIWGICLTHLVHFLFFLNFFYLGVSLTHPVGGGGGGGSFSGMQFSLKTASEEKSCVEGSPEKEIIKKSHSKQRRNPPTPYTEQSQTKQNNKKEKEKRIE